MQDQKFNWFKFLRCGEHKSYFLLKYFDILEHILSFNADKYVFLGCLPILVGLFVTFHIWDSGTQERIWAIVWMFDAKCLSRGSGPAPRAILPAFVFLEGGEEFLPARFVVSGHWRCWGCWRSSWRRTGYFIKGYWQLFYIDFLKFTKLCATMKS